MIIRGKEKWKEVIEAQKQSGLTIKNYCNLEFLKTDVDKRKDKLIDITKKFIKPSKEYQKMEKRIKEYAKKHQIPIFSVFKQHQWSQSKWSGVQHN